MKSLKVCGVAEATHGSKDGDIYCLKLAFAEASEKCMARYKVGIL